MIEIVGHSVDEGRLAAVCRRYGIARLLVFGSAVRGTAEPGSDVDVLYELLPGRRMGWEVGTWRTNYPTFSAGE